MRNKREAVKDIAFVILLGFAALRQVSSQENVPKTAENQSSSQEFIDAAHRLSDLSQLGSYVLTADIHAESRINGQHDGRLTIYRDHESARLELQFGNSTDIKIQTKDKTYIGPEFSFIDAIGLSGFDQSWDPENTESLSENHALSFGDIKVIKVHKLEMRCVQREFKGTNPRERVQLCFDSQQPVLLNVASGTKQLEFFNYTQQGPVLLPSRVNVSGTPIPVEISHIMVVQKPLDSSLILPFANSLELDRCDNQQPPKALDTPEPSYAEVARKKSIQGTVVLGVLIDKRGKVANARVLIPLDPDLDWRAKGAVKAWKFKPSMCGGQPVAIAITVEVVFRLD